MGETFFSKHHLSGWKFVHHFNISLWWFWLHWKTFTVKYCQQYKSMFLWVFYGLWNTHIHEMRAHASIYPFKLQKPLLMENVGILHSEKKKPFTHACIETWIWMLWLMLMLCSSIIQLMWYSPSHNVWMWPHRACASLNIINK